MRKAISFRVSERFGERKFIKRSVAGFTLHILNFSLIIVQVAISHRFGSGVTVHAVQCVFALRKLRDRLVVIINAFCRGVGALHKCHRPQVVVAAVMASVALCVGNGSCKFMLFGGVTGRAARLARKRFAFTRHSVDMAG